MIFELEGLRRSVAIVALGLACGETPSSADTTGEATGQGGSSDSGSDGDPLYAIATTRLDDAQRIVDRSDIQRAAYRVALQYPSPGTIGFSSGPR